GRSGRNLGSAAVGSRRPASGSTGSRARGRISPSPARRGSAGSAVMASTATPTAGTGPEAEATSGSSGDKNGNSVPIPKFREHGLFETWDAEDCGQAGCSASEGGGEQGAADEPIASARVVRGARRKRFVAAGSAEARLGGGPMAPPLPPRGGVSAFSSVTAGASAAGLRSSSRRSGADTAGRGFTSDVGRDLPRDEELASPLQSLDPPRIMARPYVVTGSDYDVDDDDVKFLATLNAEASGGQWRGQQQSTVIGTDLFEDMIERLERQEDRARDRKNLMESSERLVMELDLSTSRMEDLCSEADDIFAACISQNSDKSMHSSEKPHPREKVTSGQWGEGIAKIIKGFKDAALRERSAVPTDSETAGSGSGNGSSGGGSLCSRRGGRGGGDASSSDDDSDEEVISDSTIQSELHQKGPVALTENVAMSILRKRVVAFQKSHSPGSNSTMKSQAWSHSAHEDGGGGIAAGGSSTSRGTEGSAHETSGGAAVVAGHGRGARSAPKLARAAKGSVWKGKGRAKDEQPRRSARAVGAKTLDDADKGVMEEIDDDILAEVFRYWASKREGFGGPMLRCLHYIPGAVMWERVEDPQREVEDIDEGMDPEADKEAYELLRRCRHELEQLRMLADLVKRREKNKSTAFGISTELLELAINSEQNLRGYINELRRKETQESESQQPQAHSAPSVTLTDNQGGTPGAAAAGGSGVATISAEDRNG
ncbi:unnamed protein product, partial [Sphacelaria rigidula]